MSDEPISDLRRRLLQDMTNRNFGAKTQHDYIRHIETFAKFLGRAPDTATGDDIRRFQAEQIAQGAQPAATLNRTIATCCTAFARQTQAQPAQSPLRPPQTKCPNTHSDRGTPTARPPAGSFPAGFRMPALVPVASSARAGIRNPQQYRKSAPAEIAAPPPIRALRLSVK